MKKFYFLLSLLFVFSFFTLPKVKAQCPTLDPAVGTSDYGPGIEVCLQSDSTSATITFTFLNDGSDFENFLLYDVANNSYLIEGLSPVVYVHTPGSNVWEVQNVPDQFVVGTNSIYVFAKVGCPTYGGTGIDIKPEDKLRIDDANITITHNTRCLAPYNGAINVTPTGGYGSYTYSWSGPGGYTANTQNISDLGVGIYTVTVTDGHNCTFTKDIEVLDNSVSPTVSFSGLNATGEYCVNDPVVLLTGSEAPSGTFSGPGVTDNGNGTADFDPSIAGSGGDIIYTYTDALGCTGDTTRTVSIYPLPPDPTNPVDNEFCAGDPTTPISVDDPGTGYRVDWYDASTGGTLVGTGASFTPPAAGTYWAEIVSDAGGCPSANRVSATLTENPLPSDATNPVDNEYCIGSPTTAISVDDPGVGFRVDWYDANTGGNLVATGPTFTPIIAGTFWAEIINETTGCASANRVSATLTENPLPPDAANPVDNAFCAGDAPTSISVDDPGVGFRVDWYDASTGGAFIGTGATFTPPSAGTYWAEVVNETTGCISANRVSATLIEEPIPADATNPVDNEYCAGSALTAISVDDPGAGYQVDWYDAQTGGTLVGSGVSFIPPAAGTYWAEVVSTTAGCVSANRVSATLTENPLPPDATNPVDNEYCAGGALPAISVDDPGTGYRVDWYDASTSGNLVGTGAFFTPPSAGTYWAEIVNETTSCTSANRISATLTENPLPPDATNPVDNTFCAGSATTPISVDDPGTGFRVDWYDANTGGTLVGSGTVFTPAAAGTYWAEIVNETTGCISLNRVSATLNEEPIPPDATNPVDNEYCAGSPLTSISVDDLGTGYQIDWYDAQTGGTLVGSGASFTPPAAGTYWAEVVSTAAGCVSANRVSATLTENPLPADATNPVDNEYCEGSSTTPISVDDPGTGFRVDWYDANAGGNLVATGPTFTPASAGTYWAEVINETTGCASANRVSAMLTENPKPPAITISGNTNPACQATGEVYSVSGLPNSTYVWTVPVGATIVGPADGPSITVNFGLNSGDITVQEIADGTGCIGDVAALTINLQSCPFTADFTMDVTELCVNGTVVFTDASIAPIGTNYSWDFGEGATPATANTQGPHSVVYSTSGVKSITLTITNGPDISSVTKNLTVSDPPTASLSGDATICPGSSTALTVELTGKAPWIFVYSDGTTDYTENINSSPYLINVNPVATTTYTPVSVSDALCSGSVSGSATVNVSPQKNVTLKLDSVNASPGTQVKVPVRVIDYTNLMTMQFTVRWDPTLLTYNGVSDINIGNISSGSFGEDSVAYGILTFSWNTASLSDTTIVSNTDIFSVVFDVANTVCSDAGVTVDGSVTPIEMADQNLCLANVSVIGGNVGIQAVASITSSDSDNVICYGENIIFTGLPGGMPNYKFYLNGTLVQDDASNVYVNNALVDQDSVNVIVSDANGCTLAAQGLVMTVNQIIITPTIMDISGCGLADGAISLAITGGSGDYSYNWSGPSITDPSLKDQSGLARGFYSVVVTDNVSGCTETLDIELKEPVNFILSYTKTDVSSTGGNDGSIDLTITGGTGPFTISWTGPGGFTSNNEDISDLYAGTYIATVTDNGSGCTDAIVVELTQPVSGLVLNATKTDVTTCGASDGTINLIISGGSGSYGVSWIGPNGFTSNDRNLTGLEGGLYIATVIDLVTSITAQWTVQIDEPQGFTLSANVKDITYCDSADGSIVLTVSGGSGDFSYSWKDLDGRGFTSTDKDIFNLELGNYRVSVIDNIIGCIDSLDAFVGRPAICDQPCDLYVESTTNNTSCPDSLDGVAVINIISGGSGPGNYYVSLDTGKTFVPFLGQDITAIIDQGQGSYLYIVKDTITGCMDTTVAHIGVSVNMMANISLTNPGCAQNDGRITFSVSGGVVPYEVEIIDSVGNVTTMTGNGFFQFMNLTAGSYFYQIREQTGCMIVASDSIELQVDCQSGCTSLIASAHSFEDATCASNPDGKAVIDVIGGSSPYEYSVDGVNWIKFISGNVVNQLPPNGIYNIVVRQDSANASCRAEVSVEIYGPTAIVQEKPIITIQEASCNQNDGAVKIGRITGGSPPYNYQIDGNYFVLPADSIVTDLGAGMHTFSVVDNVGCREDFAFEVASPGVIVATLTDVPVSCSTLFLKAGIRIELDLPATTLPGPYEALVSSTSEPGNETIYQIPDNGIRTILNLDKDFYNVTIRSTSVGGCTFSEMLPVFSGAYPVEFDIIDMDTIVSCIGDLGSITIGNVKGDPDTTFIVQLVREDDVILETYELQWFELEGGFTIDETKTDKLIAGRYFIRLIQNQKECVGVEAVSPIITIFEPVGQLGFEVLEDQVSFPDRPTGYIIGEVIPSGGTPYEAIIQLLDPEFEMNITDIIEFNSKRTWVEVPSTGDDLLRYPVKFDSLWAGLYEIRVRDSYGCEFVMEYRIGYDETVFIPNVFTPNGDGYNDTFYIRNLPETGTQVIITNRNGFVVFKSDNYTYDNLWDGGDLADGIYYYNVTMPNGDAYKGWVEKWSGSRP